jgi:tRNA threonylcarbamoyladenosine biosynthesis protein TsaB
VSESCISAARSDAPNLLAIETAGSRCSAAVAHGKRILAAASQALRHGHGEVLVPMLDRVMAEAALPPHQLDIVAAAIGPGGFTGIRVGLAAAQGIALATGARLVGITGFAAVAQALRNARAGGQRGSNLLVALDSRRDDLYIQLFAADMTSPHAPPQAVLPDLLEDYLGAPRAAPLLVAGDAAEAAAAALHGRIDVEVVPDSAPDAIGIALVALEAARSAEAPEPVRPLYLRPPDVTLRKPRGIAAARPALTSRVVAIPPGAAVPLALLHGACFPEDPWDVAALERVMALAGGFGFCAWQTGAPVGFVLARDLGGEVEILSLGVLPETRRQGIGHALVRAVFAEAERRGGASIVLEVAADNAAARALYAGLGFLPVGRRPRYYSRPASVMDALILRCMITAEPQPTRI